MTAEIRSFFESYRKGAHERADFEERSFIGQVGDFPIADQCCAVWRHAGNESRGFRTSRHQCRGEGKWKILTVMEYEEKRFCKEEHAS